MMSWTFGLFTQVSGSGPLSPLVMIFEMVFFLFETVGENQSLINRN